MGMGMKSGIWEQETGNEFTKVLGRMNHVCDNSLTSSASTLSV